MKHSSFLILLAVSLTACSTCQPPTPDVTLATANVSPAKGIELVGHVGGVANAVAAQGDYLYASFGSELAILDISDPTVPKRVGYTVLEGIVEDIFVADRYAYVFILSSDPDNSFGTPGLCVVDISNPSDPIQTHQISMPGYVVGIASHYVYVANWDELKVVDISDPAAPTEVDAFSAPAPIIGMAVADMHAHVVWSVCYRAACTNGMSVLDISDPSIPKRIGSLDIPVTLSTPIAVAENHIYVGYYDGLYIVDVSDPGKPIHVGDLETGQERPMSIAIMGDRAYVVHADGSLAVLDISDPSSPVAVFAGKVLQQAEDMVVVASHAQGHTYACVSGGDAGGLQVIDISNPTTPAKVGRYGPPGEVASMAVAGDYAYIVDTSGQFWIVDVSNLPKFTQDSFHVRRIDDYSYWSGNVAIAANYAYVTIRTDLQVIDVSNPSAPASVGSSALFSAAVALASQDDYAYVVTAEGWTHDTLRVMDVSDPAAPLETGRINIADPETEVWTRDVFVAGDYAYITGTERLWIIDVSDPARPGQVGLHETPGGARNVVVKDDHAYIADGLSGLRVFDVSDPTNPIDAGHVGIAGLTVDVAVGNGRVYVLNEQEGLWVWDISSPAAPANPRNYYISGRPVQVAIAGDLVYVLDAMGGLYVLQAHD